MSDLASQTMNSAEKQDYDLHATAVVGCGISLFFCFISIIAFIFFRPRTESFIIKEHLSAALGITQILLLLSIAAYRSNEGCQAISVLLHYSATACFAWCFVDSLHLYFHHTNISNALRKKIVYFLFGWGVPIIVLVMSLAIGFTTKGRRSPVLAFYTCWPTDNIVWAFVIPSLLIATFNLSILCIILHHLRQPSYDICGRAVLERRATRYGLRTNSLMLLGLCLGWIFGILSFREVNNVRYQLSFGLINGLQGIFLFFFHCVLNIDIKGYYESGVHQCSHEDGCLTDRERSKRGMPQTQDLQAASRRKISSKSNAENVPLISVGATAKKQVGEDSPSGSKSADLKSDSKHFEVAVIQSEKAVPLKSSTEKRAERPDQQAYPSLPGTPEPHVPDMDPRLPQRHTLPAQLVSKGSKKEVEGISKSATLRSLSSYKASDGTTEHRPPTTDRLKVQSNVEKTNSEPLISPPAEQQTSQPSPHAAATIVTGGNDARKLSVQSSASSGGSERKPRRSSRSQQVSSLNELESLFSNPMYVKPHRQSLSSLHGSGGKDRKLSCEIIHMSESRRSSRNTEETML